mgnify:CR=1 FL=1
MSDNKEKWLQIPGDPSRTMAYPGCAEHDAGFSVSPGFIKRLQEDIDGQKEKKNEV